METKDLELFIRLLFAVVSALSCEAAEPDRTIIPLPAPAFEGKIGKTYKNSEAAWPKLRVPPVGPPNVVVSLLDDVDYGRTRMESAGKGAVSILKNRYV
ncbi:MAG: hypothetical protein JNL18_22490 [Planctomycetaceae bacterium]|uniref:Uncharacterized protein n=1 Tax=Lacipirellula limnantheis TaxID=2528024 RepID=A0A517TYT7_9BACT|nr:hypothetical protein [Lacipirellula limnantheis]MBL9165511.1 hypothetical protein [Planctomycetaceae bacterium]QDT73515.1 hypothetical protein I41_27040 [Lacipirellula limnantheis]